LNGLFAAFKDVASFLGVSGISRILDLLGCSWFAWVLVAESVFNFNFFIETFKLNLQGLLPCKREYQSNKALHGSLKLSLYNMVLGPLQDKSGEHAYSNKHLPTRPESRSPVR